MPRILVPPGFGISTIRTGPGKYDPDDMRFHSLYRLPVRFPSNCSIVTPSEPAAPPFSLIFSQASHTSIFGMSYDLPCNLGSLPRLIPLGLTAFINQDGPSPWLHPHYRASQLLRDGPPAWLLSATLGEDDRVVVGRHDEDGFLRSCAAPWWRGTRFGQVTGGATARV